MVNYFFFNLAAIHLTAYQRQARRHRGHLFEGSPEGETELQTFQLVPRKRLSGAEAPQGHRPQVPRFKATRFRTTTRVRAGSERVGKYHLSFSATIIYIP